MALSPANLIAGVKATLVGITGIDPLTVYDRRRDVRDEPGARALWYSEGQQRIHAWNVTLARERPASSARGPGFSRTQAGQVSTDFGITIEGVMGIDDANASEVTFRDLAWTVTLAFNQIGLLSVPSVGLNVGDVVHQEATQWEQFGYLILASMYTVHYARLSCRFAGHVSP